MNCRMLLNMFYSQWKVSCYELRIIRLGRSFFVVGWSFNRNHTTIAWHHGGLARATAQQTRNSDKNQMHSSARLPASQIIVREVDVSTSRLLRVQFSANNKGSYYIFEMYWLEAYRAWLRGVPRDEGLLLPSSRILIVPLLDGPLHDCWHNLWDVAAHKHSPKKRRLVNV